MTIMDDIIERTIVWSFRTFDPGSSVPRKLAGTVVLVPMGLAYCAGMLVMAIWTEREERRCRGL